MSANMHCCACPSAPLLTALELAPGLPARHCIRCDGHWVRLDDHRAWREQGARTGEEPEVVEHWLADQSEGARHCPACNRIMERVRSGRTPDIRIDRCLHCHAVWLDGGEWAALQFQGAVLDEVVSDIWQRQLREEATLERRRNELAQRLGHDVVAEIERVRHWLGAQRDPDVVLQLIRHGI